MTEHTEQKDIEFAKAMAQMSDAIGEMTSALLSMATVAAMLVDITKKLREIEPMLEHTFHSPVYHAPDIVSFSDDGKLIHHYKDKE